MSFTYPTALMYEGLIQRLIYSFFRLLATYPASPRPLLQRSVGFKVEGPETAQESG
jgi:hypothetical protein